MDFGVKDTQVMNTNRNRKFFKTKKESTIVDSFLSCDALFA
jgi:hypothetical protein